MPKTMGRPPKPPHLVRNKVLNIKMTAAEHAAIMELAKRLGRPAGEIMRSAALAAAAQAGIKTPPPE